MAAERPEMWPEIYCKTLSKIGTLKPDKEIVT
jgi:hypothetical protein